MDRTLMEMMRCMLKDCGFNKSYWCEALIKVADIRNVCRNSFKKSSRPFEMV